MPSLKQEIISSVPPKEFYDWYFELEGGDPLRWPNDGSDIRVSAPDRNDENPSMYLNPNNGSWFDHGAESETGDKGHGGNSIISFYSAYEEMSTHEACAELYHHFVRPTISAKTVRRWNRTALKTKRVMDYLRIERMITADTVKQYKIGWDGDRITFPIENEHGLFINAKRYDPIHRSRRVPKMLNYKEKGEERRFGSPSSLFPFSSIKVAHQEGFIVIVEGEWDALFLNQLGIPAITSTAGAKNWPKGYNDLFRNLEVIICFDNDETGTIAGKKLIRKLVKHARRIKQLQVPKKYGKDVGDWAKGSPIMRTTRGWVAKIKRAKVIIENPEDYVEARELKLVPLDKARNFDNIGKKIRVKAVVAGKATDPRTVPLKYRITCEDATADPNCPLNNSTKDFVEGEIDPQSEFMFDLLHKNKTQVNSVILKRHGFDPRSESKPVLEILEYASFEEVRIQPAFDTEVREHVTAQAFTLGLGLRSNQTYYFTGTAFPSEIAHITKLIFTGIEPAQSQVDTFKMTPDMITEFNRFKPKGQSKTAVMRKLMQMADWQSRNITKIRNRPDLHTIVDLVYHSVNEFDFNGEYVHRGMLDVMVIGDTRCGKGYVAEGLQRYYGLGEVASGENCSFAGLVGGVQQLGRQWFITWGLIPMNHGRLVTIDEASAIPDQGGFGRLSRVRSEGVAEITKIVRESSMAKARLLWLANPISGRPIMTYSSGAHAIKELVGANEDISRFDLALTVAADEVDAEIINEVNDQDEASDAGRYPKASLRSLVMWAWSRKRDQVHFTKAAVKEVIKTSIDFGKYYSSSIPLIQAENVRIKLAKISAAVASRVFSSDQTGEILVIDKQHVETAAMIMRQAYSKPSMGYDAFSQKDKHDKQMKPIDVVQAIFDDIRDNTGDEVIKYFISHTTFTSEGLADIIPAEEDPKEIIRRLVAAKCIERASTKSWYRHTMDFRKWLNNQRRKLYE